MSRTLVLRFDEPVAKRLEELRVQTGAAKRIDVLRAALAFYDTCLTECAAGKKLILRDAGDNEVEVSPVIAPKT